MEKAMVPLIALVGLVIFLSGCTIGSSCPRKATDIRSPADAEYFFTSKNSGCWSEVCNSGVFSGSTDQCYYTIGIGQKNSGDSETAKNACNLVGDQAKREECLWYAEQGS